MGKEHGLEPLAFEDGAYRTPHRRISAFPTASFYPRFIACIVKYARIAERGGYGKDEWADSSLTIMRDLEAVGVRFEITGAEHMSSFEGPCVFAANHMSALETFCLQAIIVPFKPATFVVKESLLRYPVFGHIMRGMGAIAVTRRNPRKDLRTVLDAGGRKLKDGLSVIIFPQTTRAAVFDPKEFNSLGVKLARKAGVPVVPIALKTDAWGAGPVFLRDFGRIDPSRTARIAFGAPLEIKGTGDEEHKATVEFIASKLREWGE